MLAIGVTGNIGSGKTTVCKIFEGLGIDVYYADAMAKRLYQTDSELKEGVLNLFGDASYDSNGELVRQVLSDAIYRNAKLREALNELVHPRVFADFKDWCDQKRALGKSYVIKEAAILFESGADKTVDLVIGADGVRSNMRTALLGPSAPFFTGQVAWRALVCNSMDHPNKVMVHMGPGRHIVSYPLRGGSLVNLVMVQERSLWAGEGWSHRDDPAHVRAAFADFGAAMKDSATRLILVEHVTVNLIAIVLATVVNAKNKKAITDAAKFKNMWLLNGLGLVLILSRIPWSRLAALFA